ncbi:MAG: lipid A biosynthesis acyltransferase [Azospira oryzae]|nr:lipid A biosynthesis acyltransferase [Cytophaga sp.]PZR30102.1 MAG: lipid A biosynthesis acyltransferase [Azospira oryzae]
MSEWQGKSKGTKLGYRIVFSVCSKLGVRPAYLLLRFVAFYYFLFSFSSSHAIYRYFRERHGFNVFQSLRKLYRNYYVFAQTLLDKIIIMAGIKNDFTFHFDGVENLHQIVSEGKGGILISAHVGNWEAAGHLLEHLHTRINIVMFDGEHQQIKNYLKEVTGGRNFNVIVVRDDISHVYAIGEALQKNEIVCLHADRFLPGNKIKTINFLGKEASFPIGPFAMVSTFKVPVSFVFAFKESATHYHLYGSKPITFPAGENRSKMMDSLMETFVGNLERMMRKYPEQWFNYYNFWK